MSTFTRTGLRSDQLRAIPPEMLKRFYTRSDLAGVLQTAGHLALLVAGGWLVWQTRGSWWVIPAVLLQAVFVNSLFGAMHESVHYGSFKTRWLADLVAFFAGAAILNNAGFYRHYHMAHHAFTQDPERDPELITARVPATWGQYLLRMSALPFVALRARDIFLFPFGLKGDVTYLPDKAWPEVRLWGRWLLAFYAALIVLSLAFKTTVVLWVWVVPLVVGLPLLRAYLICEHTLCPNSDDGFRNTRTTTTNPAVRFLMWNLPYHAEHHLFPNIAFHHLPEAHRHLRPHLKYVARTYSETHREIIKSFA